MLTKKFPTDELYSLTSQIRRAAVSIPVNIAEGCGKNSDKDLMRYLDISNGSAFELETLIILANDLNYLSPEETEELIKEIQEIEKMIFNFKQKFKGPWHSLTIPHLVITSYSIHYTKLYDGYKTLILKQVENILVIVVNIDIGYQVLIGGIELLQLSKGLRVAGCFAEQFRNVVGEKDVV